MKNIYGTIGYTILEDNNNKNKIIVMADMHNTLPDCGNQIEVSDWFKNKLVTSEILLEEVPRENVNLIELWSNSKHTQSLKKLYLDNPKQIKAIDIRPFLVPFSWEIVETSNPDHKITLKEYICTINDFFEFNHPYFIKNQPFYDQNMLVNNNLGNHFFKIKKNFIRFIITNKIILDQKIYNIKIHKTEILEKINDILSDIMEWNICADIYGFKNKSIILHTGLAHSEKIINWLINQYNYYIVSSQGINQISQTFHTPLNGCIKLPFDLDVQFGGLADFN